MATTISTRPTDNRFVGNKDPNHTEVHDLTNESGNCQIDEIISAGNGVVFSPDTLDQAHSEDYDNCSWCLGGSAR
jgi:hypothetical protein